MGGKGRKRNRSETLVSNLPQLQNLIRRDPSSYKQEFLTQWRHWTSALTLLQLSPQHTQHIQSLSVGLPTSKSSSNISNDKASTLQKNNHMTISVAADSSQNEELSELILFLAHVSSILFHYLITMLS